MQAQLIRIFHFPLQFFGGWRLSSPKPVSMATLQPVTAYLIFSNHAGESFAQ